MQVCWLLIFLVRSSDSHTQLFPDDYQDLEGSDACQAQYLGRFSRMICASPTPENMPQEPQPNIQFLTFTGSLPKLTHHLFKHFPNLEVLFAKEVGVEIIEPDALINSKAIDTIHLSCNNLTAIPVNFIKDSKVETFLVYHNLGLIVPHDGPFLISNKLIDLDLGSCKITQINIETFAQLPHLKILSLQNNLIETLPDSVFAKNIDLITLNLAMNRIKMLKFDSFQHLRQLASLYFEENEWDCNCTLVAPSLSQVILINGEGYHKIQCDQTNRKEWKDIVHCGIYGAYTCSKGTQHYLAQILGFVVVQMMLY